MLKIDKFSQNWYGTLSYNDARSHKRDAILSDFSAKLIMLEGLNIGTKQKFWFINSQMYETWVDIFMNNDWKQSTIELISDFKLITK